MMKTTGHTHIAGWKLFTLIAGLAAVCSCRSESFKNIYANQEKWIEGYLNSELSRVDTFYTVSNRGTERLVIIPGEGNEAGASSKISLYYAGYVLSSQSVNRNNLFDTNSKAIAEEANWKMTDSTERFRADTLSLSNKDIVEGLKNGLVGVKKGQECMILFSGKHGFGKKANGTIPANSAIAYHIWVEEILK